MDGTSLQLQTATSDLRRTWATLAHWMVPINSWRSFQSFQVAQQQKLAFLNSAGNAIVKVDNTTVGQRRFQRLDIRTGVWADGFVRQRRILLLGAPQSTWNQSSPWDLALWCYLMLFMCLSVYVC